MEAKYFIQNTITKKLFVFAYNCEPTITCSNPRVTYHRHEPTEDEFWTTDLKRAWTFSTRERAEDFLRKQIEFVKRRGFLKDGKYCYFDAGYDFENCIVVKLSN